VCFLISPTITKDALKQEIKTDGIPRQVFCSTTNISRQEFNVSMQAGLKAEKVIIIDHDEYDGEEKLKYANKNYSVYRTFVRPDNFIELYCEVRIGGN
jgi:hypothetical protein